MKAEHAWRVLERAGVPRRCALCHREYELEVHHINRNHHDDRLENLCFLCRPCHLARHIDPKSRWWKPEDWEHCDICGKLCLCGFNPEGGNYICYLCFRKEFQQTHPDTDSSTRLLAHIGFRDSQHSVVEFRKELQLVNGFARKYLETDPKAFEPKDKVYSAFINFCIEEKLPKMKRWAFKVLLPQCVPVRVDWYKILLNKRQVCCWCGIRFKNFGTL